MLRALKRWIRSRRMGGARDLIEAVVDYSVRVGDRQLEARARELLEWYGCLSRRRAYGRASEPEPERVEGGAP